MLRLGVIGLSEGNGHPYSWSAICNGYDAETMAHCPFPAIPEYLALERFPEARLPGACVTHVWTQEHAVSEHIARSALIGNVCKSVDEMTDEVDAVLLARDDAETHLELARPFLEAGLPVYVDKPLATRVSEGEALFALASRPAQLFSCSALRYAAELQPGDGLGRLEAVEARAPKGWRTYAAHAIEPVVSWLAGPVEAVEATRDGAATSVRARFGDVDACFSTTGTDDGGIEIDLHGTAGTSRLRFHDPFSAFRSALAAFLAQVRTGVEQIPRRETMTVVSLIEAGCRA